MSYLLDLIDSYRDKVMDDKIYFHPNLPKKKLKNAITSYAEIGEEEVPLLLIDDTIFGSAKDGVLITDKAMYFKGSFESGKVFYFQTITSLTLSGLINQKITINQSVDVLLTQPSKKSLLLIIEMLNKSLGLTVEKKNKTVSWGKAGIGAGIGGIVGGPIGAAIGAAVGASWDSESTEKEVVDEDLIFSVSYASILAKMVIADGHIDDKEIDEVLNLFSDLSEKESNILTKAFENALEDEYSIFDYAEQYTEVADYQLREYLYKCLCMIAISDGHIHKDEALYLKEILPSLNLPKNKFEEFMSLVAGTTNTKTKDLKESYDILGSTPEDNMRVIKQRYRRLVSEYHSDKIQSKGLPDSFIQFATEKTQLINKAYDTVKKHQLELAS